MRRLVFRPKPQLLATLVLGILTAFSPMRAQAQDDPPQQAGRLAYVAGDVAIEPAGSQTWGQAYGNLPLGPGDRIVTQGYGRAEIQIGQTWVHIGHDADVTLVDATANAVTFGVAAGSARVHSNGLLPNQVLYVQTPSGSTTTSQPADFRIDVMPSDSAAVFTDNYGPVYISGAGDFGVETNPGQALELVGTNPVYPQWLQPASPDDLDSWSMTRDEQIAHSEAFQYVSRDIPSAADLDGNGYWQPDSPYGPAWFPRVEPGWAPYRNGHWIHRPPWGWTWVENELWGDAPFHYGRWVVIDGRWGWIPGPPTQQPVWSPALVVFAGADPGVSVWFPLGPGEPYRPWYRCSPEYIDRVNISNIRPAPRVEVHTTYVNIVNVNITNITYVNRSAGYTAIRQDDFASGRSPAKVAVHVDLNLVSHAQVLAAPRVQPTRESVIAPPPRVEVKVAASRPALINAQGRVVAAQPHAQPVEAPVHPVSHPAPPPGRTVVAKPATAKVVPPSQHLTPSGKPKSMPEVQPAPATAGKPAPETKTAPAAAPPAKPAATAKPVPAAPSKAAAPPSKSDNATRPAPSQPAPAPASKPAPGSAQAPVATHPAPDAKQASPPAKPGTKPAAKPEDKNKKPNNEKDKKPEDQKPQ